MAVLCAVVDAAAADDAAPRNAPSAADVEPVAPSAASIELPVVGRANERAAVRGCGLDQACGSALDGLREFELEKFPPPSSSPWLDGGSTASHAGEVRSTRPTEVRPDLPWLADLELPDLPVIWDRRLIDYLLFYKDDPRGRRLMREWMATRGRYRDLIARVFRAAKLPEDLLYVAMIESGYNPRTVSRVGASGLWQFMPDSGRVYGLTINRWIDERNDPVRATHAAAAHWADLYQRFGDWSLAIAAYNAGYGAVLKGVARFNSNNFWALLDYENALPWESSIYVPKAMAVAIVGHNLERFGYGEIESAPAEAWDEVELSTSIALSTLAQVADCSVSDLKRLNPHLRRDRTPPGGNFSLRVPVGRGADLATRLKLRRGDWDRYDVYVMHYGERFEDVATQFGISRSKLRQLNDIDSEAEIIGGTRLVVPRVAAAVRARNLEKANDDLYGSGVDHQPGEALIVAVPDRDADVAGKRRVFYRVVQGETLAVVSRALGIATAELAGWNGLAEDAKLHPRMVLQAWMDPAWSEEAAHVRLLDETRIVVVSRGSKEHLELSEARSGRERFEYTASRAESFEQIGRKYGLGKRDVARINRLPPDTVVEPGQTVVVYRVVDRKRSERAARQWRQQPRASKKTTKPEVAKRSGRTAADEDAREAKVPAGAKRAEAEEQEPGEAESSEVAGNPQVEAETSEVTPVEKHSEPEAKKARVATKAEKQSEPEAKKPPVATKAEKQSEPEAKKPPVATKAEKQSEPEAKKPPVATKAAKQSEPEARKARVATTAKKARVATEADKRAEGNATRAQAEAKKPQAEAKKTQVATKADPKRPRGATAEAARPGRGVAVVEKAEAAKPSTSRRSDASSTRDNPEVANAPESDGPVSSPE